MYAGWHDLKLPLGLFQKTLQLDRGVTKYCKALFKEVLHYLNHCTTLISLRRDDAEQECCLLACSGTASGYHLCQSGHDDSSSARVQEQLYTLEFHSSHNFLVILFTLCDMVVFIPT